MTPANMTKRCIINVACGAWYPAGQERLKASLKLVGNTADLLFWRNQLPPDSPAHEDTPYAFKPAAFVAARNQGYEQILWADASFWAIRPFDAIWDELAEVGHVFPPEAFSVGTWCTDAALKSMGLTREEAWQIDLVKAGFMGFDLTHERSRRFLDQWYHYSRDGVTFKGPWKRDGLDTDNPKVLGHRHDLTAASVVAWRLGMERSESNLISCHWENPPDGVLFMYRGGTWEGWRETMRV